VDSKDSASATPEKVTAFKINYWFNYIYNRKKTRKQQLNIIVCHSDAQKQYKRRNIILGAMDWTVALLTTMGGATIGAGVNMPHLAKVRGRGGAENIVYILHACEEKYTLHVFSMLYLTFWQINLILR